MKKYLILILITLILFAFAQGVYAASLGQINDIAKEFICNCGCTKLLPYCDMGCGEALRGVIGKKIDAGWDKERIIAYMIKNYNEQILSAPTKKGFNLTAWITPFIAIALGGLGIGLVILAWVKSTQSRELIVESQELRGRDLPAGRQRQEVGEQKDKKPKIDNEKYKEKLDKELKDFDW